MAQFSLGQQIEEVERELAKRREVYPRLAGSGKERKSVLDYQMARMESVLKTLKWMQQNETTIKAAVKQPEQPASLHMHVKDEPAPPYPGTKPGGIAERASGQPYPAEGK